MYAGPNITNSRGYRRRQNLFQINIKRRITLWSGALLLLGTSGYKRYMYPRGFWQVDREGGRRRARLRKPLALVSNTYRGPAGRYVSGHGLDPITLVDPWSLQEIWLAAMLWWREGGHRATALAKTTVLCIICKCGCHTRASLSSDKKGNELGRRRPPSQGNSVISLRPYKALILR